MPAIFRKELASVVTTDSRVIRHSSKEVVIPEVTGTPEDRPTRGAGAVALAAAGLAAAFGVASCCGLPFLLATAGFGTAWLSSIALAAAPHRGFLLAAATICLVSAGALLWRQERVAVCATGAICSRPAARGITLACLLVGLALLYLGYAYA